MEIFRQNYSIVEVVTFSKLIVKEFLKNEFKDLISIDSQTGEVRVELKSGRMAYINYNNLNDQMFCMSDYQRTKQFKFSRVLELFKTK